MVTKINGDCGTDGQSNSARKKDKNFTREEDIFLCRSWMTTPGDPEAGTDQASMTFWERAGEKYASLIGNNYVSRSGQSLPQRWTKIRAAVSRFGTIYKNISHQNPDSYTEEDMINMALITYKRENKEKFKLLHCWTELRNSFKWNQDKGPKARRRNAAQQSSLDEQFSPDEDDDFPTPTDTLESSPISAVPLSAFTCSSGDVDFDLHDHTTEDAQTDIEQAKSKKKESNYTQEEDVLLCKAWMTTSGDVAKAKDDDTPTVWERIAEKYEILIGSDFVPRTGKSLTQRWNRIRPAVLKFSEIYKKINDQNPASSEEDKITMARVTYKKEGHRKFKFHHCWDILRCSRKWKKVVPGARARKSAMYSQELITSEHSGSDDDSEPLAIEGQQVGCEKGEGLDAVPASHYPLPALPALVSSAQGHAGMDVKTEVSEHVSTRKNESNFTQEEDILLCKAWMETKGDTKIRGDQSSETLWEKIGSAYARLIGNKHVPRLGKSLPQRWFRIRTAVAKFCSIYKNINDQKAGSISEVDKINMAVLTFQKEQKEKFKFLHCWTELRNSPKWNFETTYGIQYRRRHAAMLSQQSSSEDDDDNDSPMPTPKPLDQPKQQKQATQNRKRQDVDTSSSEMEGLLPQPCNLVREMLVDGLEMGKSARKRKLRDGDTGSSEVEELAPHSQDLVREMFAQKVKKLDELLEIEREKRETKIMLIDPTTLPDGRRQYFETLQQKILERVCGTPPPK